MVGKKRIDEKTRIHLIRRIDHHIVSSRLGEYVEQRTNVPQFKIKPNDIDEFLGDDLSNFQAHGLETLPDEKLQKLVNDPRLLLDLQGWLYTHGGKYWHARLKAVGYSSSTNPKEAFEEKTRPKQKDDSDHRSTSSIKRGLLVSLSCVIVFGILATAYYGLFVANSKNAYWQPPTQNDLPAEESVDVFLNAVADSFLRWNEDVPDQRSPLQGHLDKFDQMVLAIRRYQAANDIKSTDDSLKQSLMLWSTQVNIIRDQLEAREDSSVNLAIKARTLSQSMADKVRNTSIRLDD